MKPASSSIFQPASAPPVPRQRYIIVGTNAARRWIVKDSREQLGAVFRSMDAALHFARREAGVLGCGILIDSGPVELACLQGC
jgi:hypothetical protein